MLKIKTVIFSLCCFAVIGLQAQNNVSSPFSRYGYGLLESGGSARNLGMGGIGIASRSNLYINTLNPASYSAVDSLNHIYDFAISARLSVFDENGIKSESNDANFQYVSMAFPVTRWMGVAAAIEGVSFVGYEQSFASSIGEDEKEFARTFNGSGGLSKIVLGAGIDLKKNISVGVNANYIFGPIDFDRTIDYSDPSSFDFYEIQSSSVHGFQLSLGMQLQLDLSKQDKIVLGATYEPAIDLNGKMSLTRYKDVLYVDDNLTTRIYRDTIDLITTDDVDFEFPEAFGAGFTYQRENKFTLGADFYLQKWSALKSKSTLELENLSDRFDLNLGMEYIPDFISPKYLNRISYRLGGHYSRNYIKDGNEDLINYGINFGVGLPLRYSKTTFNFGVELGKLEAATNSSIKESYAKFIISCALHEMWFFKRKFE